MKAKLKITIALILSIVFTYVYSEILLKYYGILINFSQEGIILSGIYSALNLLIFLIGVKEENFKKSLVRIYFMAGILMIPPIIVYGIFTAEGIIFYIMALILLLILPLTPVYLSRITSLAVNNKMHRLLLRLILSIIFTLGYGAIYEINFTKEYFSMLFDKGGNAVSLIMPMLFPMCDSGSLALTYAGRAAGRIGLIISILQGILFIFMYRLLRRINIKFFNKDKE